MQNYTLDAKCVHCDDNVTVPVGNIILFVDSQIQDCVYNWRCPECGGINHRGGLTDPGVIKWLFSIPAHVGHVSTYLPVEMTERLDAEDNDAPITVNDVLDFMLDVAPVDNLSLQCALEKVRDGERSST